jgi:hypothetical protein
MKIGRFFFESVVVALLIQSSSFAREAGPAMQQAVAQTPDKSVSASSEEKGAVSAREKETSTGNADHELINPVRPKKQISKYQTLSHTKPVPVHRSQSINTIGSVPARASAIDSRVAGLAPNHSGSSQSTSNRKISLSLSSSAAVNGQQFSNPHNPGARLAAAGGPLTASRGITVLNGTNMKRKP